MPEDLPVRVKHVNGFTFVATDEKGHSTVMDAVKEKGGEGIGFTPGRLLLASVGGCTAMDIVQLLRKRRVSFSSVEVYVGGEQESGYPAYYKKIRLKYVVKGKDVPEDEVERAIRLSKDVYCSVGATVEGRAVIETSYEIIRE